MKHLWQVSGLFHLLKVLHLLNKKVSFVVFHLFISRTYPRAASRPRPARDLESAAEPRRQRRAARRRKNAVAPRQRRHVGEEQGEAPPFRKTDEGIVAAERRNFFVDFVFCDVSTFFVCSKKKLAMFWCEIFTLCKPLVLVFVTLLREFSSRKDENIIGSYTKSRMISSWRLWQFS